MCNEYNYVKLPNHPRCDNDGYVYEHIVVAERKLGRMLKSGEVVHHVDGNKKNNNPDNLMVFASDSDHIKYHHGGTAVKDNDVYKCLSKDRRKSCTICGSLFLPDKKTSMYCSHECANIASRKVERPSFEQLIADVKELSYVKVGQKYGVSDNTIRKWINAGMV